jgi:uncharacterized protein
MEMSEKGSKDICSGDFNAENLADSIKFESGKSVTARVNESGIIIKDCGPDENKLQAYRKVVTAKSSYRWLVSYRHSDIFISCDKDIVDRLRLPLEEVYSELDNFIKENPVFLKNLLPLEPQSYYPETVSKMCSISGKFNVGPMAAVAGTVNDCLAKNLLKHCSSLVIENGGDLFVKSGSDVTINLYLENPYFNNSISIRVKGVDTPCGICSSSGTFGHSYSMGKCDLATIIASSSAAADAAATAAANSVKNQDDIQPAIDYFRTFEDISGILLIKDKKIGMWGKFELV